MSILNLLTTGVIGLLRRPEQCSLCKKHYYPQECAKKDEGLYKLYCCPVHDSIVLYRQKDD